MVTKMSYNQSTSTATAAPPKTGLNALIIACVLTVLISFIPFASAALYPIRLFVTFVHESSHALIALLPGGSVAEIVIRPDASGFTLTTGGNMAAISAAGYLGATAFGAWLLALCRTPGRAKVALTVAASISGLATVVYIHPWINPFGFFWGVAITMGLVIARNTLTAASMELLVLFLGVQCAINALLDLRTLVTLTTFDNEPTDAVLMAATTHVPALFWALAWGALALVMVFAGLRPYWRRK